MDKTPEMVRRVAEAITANNGGEWYLWLDEARAAIEAMREPTFEMVEAGATATDGSIHDGMGMQDIEAIGLANDIYGAMLDAALASPEDPEAVGQDFLRTAPDEGGRGCSASSNI